MQLDSTAFIADPELVRILHPRSTPVAGEQERVLFRQGDDPAGLYLLHSGAITLSTISRGKEVRMSFQTTAGSLVGLPGVLGQEVSELTAVAHAGAVLSFIARADFTALVEADSMIMHQIRRALATESSLSRRAILGQDSVGAGGGDSIGDGPFSLSEPRALLRAMGMFAAD